MKKNQVLKIWAVFLVFGFVLGVVSVQAVTSSIRINNNTSSTKIRKVALSLVGSTNVRKMKISNDIEFPNVQWETFKSSKTWYLDYGNGSKTVYVRYKDSKGKISDIYKDVISLKAPESMDVDFKINQSEVDEPGVEETGERYVDLYFKWSEGVEQIRISNTNNFSESDAMWVDEKNSWILTPESGEKIVYVQFLDANNSAKVISQKITYNQPKHYIPEGSLLKGQGSSVYYLGFDNKIHPFFSSAVYHSWNKDFSNIKYVSNIKLSEYKLGAPMCVRPGTWLVKFKSLPNVYAPEPGCGLKLIRSEAEAVMLYGNNWVGHIVELDLVLKSYYKTNYPEVAEEGIDRDNDGLEKLLEEEYGTSDSSKDSDSDGLSDYEELYYWFSDPNDDDSDNDGYKDGIEVVSGYSPIGSQKIITLDEGTYAYPEGTVILKDGSYYYIAENNNYRYISKKTSDSYFTSNNFDSKFVISPIVKIPFEYSSKNRLGKSDEKIVNPQVRTLKGNLNNL